MLVPNMLMLGLDESAYLVRALASVRATEVHIVCATAICMLPTVHGSSTVHGSDAW